MFTSKACLVARVSLTSLLMACSMASFATCDNTVPLTTPAENFTNNRDGTITDETTGLMWAMCLSGQDDDGIGCETMSAYLYTWDQALNAADNASGYLDYYDWRMPNVKELASILEAQCTSPALNLAVFPEVTGGSAQTWTSSPDMTDAQNVWAVDFFANGDVVAVDRDTATLHLRLVRDADGDDFEY